MIRLRPFLLAVALIATPALAQSTKVIDPSTGLAVFSSANPASVTVISSATGASASQVQGAEASGATAAVKPVGIGGVVRSAATPVLTNAQRSDLNTDINGNLVVVTAGSASSPDVGATTTAYSFQRDTYGGIVPLAVAPLVYNGSSFLGARGDANGAAIQPALSSKFISYAAVAGGIVSSTADVAVFAAGGASVRNYVCTIDLTHAVLSAASEIVIKDNATIIWRGLLQTPATDTGAGAGKVTFFPCLRGSTNVAVNVAMITSVTGGVYINLTGYTGS